MHVHVHGCACACACACLRGDARAQPAAVDHLRRELGQLRVRSELHVEEEGPHALRDEAAPEA
eukprot:scaffold16102_cov62-Phaeocystis_antarctica.AAC.1